MALSPSPGDLHDVQLRLHQAAAVTRSTPAGPANTGASRTFLAAV
ncbi:hypothetical protein [Streptomyces sp. NBC_00690]|nr:hypothetical protein [Streptomyces sp. NBC_00690]